MAEKDQKGQQKIPPGFPFMSSPVQQPYRASVPKDSWQVSQLKKSISISATDGIIKRDSSDAFQSIQDKEQLEKESNLTGEEAFVDRDDEEDESLWESEEDYFEELEERNALLEEALRERIESPFPPVYTQLMTLCESMVNGEKTIKPIPFYLNELDNYIQKKTKVFSSLPKVNNENITRSNQLMIDGLNLLEEACNGLRRYNDDNSPFHIQLVKQLLQQANEFFSEGKSLLLSVKIDKEK